MKSIKLIFMCSIALFVLSSCAVKQDGSSKSDISDFIADNGDIGETYNELTADTSMITIDGVLYRNKFQGDLILREPQIDSEPVFENQKGRFFRLTGIDHDLLYNASTETTGSPESVYCRDDQWQELNSYYSDFKNFTYQCVVEQKGSERKTFSLEMLDIKKLNELVAFCENNSYDPTSSGNPNITYSVSYSILNEPKYSFEIESNDELFSVETASFFVTDNKLVLEYYTVMSEGKTLVVDVPAEITQYFLPLINEIKFDN